MHCKCSSELCVLAKCISHSAATNHGSFPIGDLGTQTLPRPSPTISTPTLTLRLLCHLHSTPMVCLFRKWVNQMMQLRLVII